jgi:two-component system chemotaxis response regulator CheB
MVRVLVVDDSSFMRKALSIMVDRASGMTVADTASNGEEGVKKACRLEPDVVTMDVEMPKMDGIAAVREIMERAPCPILMVSSLTEKGAETTLEAMRAGAADFIPKGDSGSSLRIREVEEELIEKIRALSQSRSRLFDGDLRSDPGRSDSAAPSTDAGRTSSSTAPEWSTEQRVRTDSSPKLIVVGVSTGGPLALQHVLPALPAELPVPVAVVQHMPSQFTSSLADRLDNLSALEVVEATDGLSLHPGRAVVATGDRHLTFDRRRSTLVVRTPEHPGDSSHCPSVDVLFESACDAYGGDVLALVMTGMGKDGLRGARRIKEAGGTVLAQDEASCVVYGMPRAVAEAGLADAVLPLEQLSEALGEAAGTPALS